MAENETTHPGEEPTVAPLSALVPDPRNARRHNDRNLALIESSLREVGAARSVVVDEAGVILAGNATVAAARQAGIDRVRLVEADGSELVAVRRANLTPEQKRRLALLDNRAAELAGWDAEILASLAEDTDLAGLWEPDELADLLAAEAIPSTLIGDPDEVPPVPDDPLTRPGDLWLLGRHRLLCGDATDPAAVAHLMAGERAVLMATDPPYLVDYRGGNHPQSWANRPASKDKHWDDYVEGEAPAFFVAYLRVALAEALIENPAVYQWHADRRRLVVEGAWLEAGLLPHQTIVWVKARPVLTHSHFMWQHEPCLYGWVQGKPPARRPSADARGVWPVDQAGASDGVHPTQKPVELFARPIAYHTGPGELIYEPFAGSGTALVAAEQAGRACYALELAPAYCDVVVRRWEGLTGKQAERVHADDEGDAAA